MARKKDGPTARVLEAAGKAPGGVIRWSEAEAVYATASQSSRGGMCNNIGRLLNNYFDKVEGARGLYVLRSTIHNDNWEEDQQALDAFRNAFGSDEFGMSNGIQVVGGIERGYLRRMSQIGAQQP